MWIFWGFRDDWKMLGKEKRRFHVWCRQGGSGIFWWSSFRALNYNKQHPTTALNKIIRYHHIFSYFISTFYWKGYHVLPYYFNSQVISATFSASISRATFYLILGNVFLPTQKKTKKSEMKNHVTCKITFHDNICCRHDEGKNIRKKTFFRRI